MLKFSIDTQSEAKPFPHFWERCIFGGHASLALRDDWRKHLKICHDELGFQFVSMHGLLNDDTGIYRVIDGQKQLSFYNLDNIFDFIVGIGMKPLLCLSFTPSDMASGKKTVLPYQDNITPPKNISDWGDLVKRMIGHFQVRYGKAEVRSWLFEEFHTFRHGLWQKNRFTLPGQYYAAKKHERLGGSCKTHDRALSGAIRQSRSKKLAF